MWLSRDNEMISRYHEITVHKKEKKIHGRSGLPYKIANFSVKHQFISYQKKTIFVIWR